VVAAAFIDGFSIQIFLFYCFARWYRHAVCGARGLRRQRWRRPVVVINAAATAGA
jgi:hypothetical protein